MTRSLDESRTNKHQSNNWSNHAAKQGPIPERASRTGIEAAISAPIPAVHLPYCIPLGRGTV
ncbi:hypothetical protein CGRA01v4_12328 [Colletotrichum graminicola]|nr:hypothetical protein CGRA01v4_12328 [Colletotrichum graminicola]